LALDKRLGLKLGPELVTNGTFDTDTDWTKGAGWTIADGVASRIATGSFTNLSQIIASLTPTSGYVIEVTATVAAGAFDMRLGAGIAVGLVATISDTGQYSFRVGTIVTGTSITFVGSPTFAGTIDNISVRELKGNHATQATTAARPLTAIHPDGGVRNLLDRTEEFDDAEWTISPLT
jgi:hypothetical protein